MQLNLYKNFFADYFNTEEVSKQLSESLSILHNVKNIFFIGNGGSNAICSHMLEDYAKIGHFRTYGFSDPALITCFSNDYGYEHAMAEWLKIYIQKGDLLVAISSSGNSKNILNAVSVAKEHSATVITLSGFKPENNLRTRGDVNFYLPIENYGVVECFHQVVVHALLDEYAQQKK
ncbi:MAG: SIS domain-containing protein [Bacteroidia bacterium]|nr:SIS domain-containing protein [Bacteroidia bacterium]